MIPSETSEVFFTCPYCGETVSVIVDPSTENQQYIEDCEVCCRPIEFSVTIAHDGSVSFTVHRLD